MKNNDSDTRSSPTVGQNGTVAADTSLWSIPRPEKLPRPTYWPAALAFAVTITAFGVVSSLILSALGVVLFVVAIAMWIGEIRHEQND